jgi:hypothetical protein
VNSLLEGQVERASKSTTLAGGNATGKAKGKTIARIGPGKIPNDKCPMANDK